MLQHLVAVVFGKVPERVSYCERHGDVCDAMCYMTSRLRRVQGTPGTIRSSV